MSKLKLLLLILCFLLLFTSYDIFTDVQNGSPASHILEEVFIVILNFLALYLLFKWLKEQETELLELKKDLDSSTDALTRQSKDMEEARKNYSKVISEQFASWKLSNAEKQTGYALLKGLSFKEIALIRDIKEKTVRQHASNLYAKADLNGRHALSAWFFEDFMNE